MRVTEECEMEWRIQGEESVEKTTSPMWNVELEMVAEGLEAEEEEIA